MQNVGAGDCSTGITAGFAYVANQNSGDVSAYKIDSAGGALTPVGTSKSGVAPASVATDPLGHCLYVANSQDSAVPVTVFAINTSSGALTPIRRAGTLTFACFLLFGALESRARAADWKDSLKEALEGRRIGRAPLDIDREQVVRDRCSGMSLTQVAKKYRISRASVVRFVKEAKNAQMVAAA